MNKGGQIKTQKGKHTNVQQTNPPSMFISATRYWRFLMDDDMPSKITFCQSRGLKKVKGEWVKE
jgi:hypothetical protein